MDRSARRHRDLPQYPMTLYAALIAKMKMMFLIVNHFLFLFFPPESAEIDYGRHKGCFCRCRLSSARCPGCPLSSAVFPGSSPDLPAPSLGIHFELQIESCVPKFVSLDFLCQIPIVIDVTVRRTRQGCNRMLNNSTGLSLLFGWRRSSGQA